MSQKTLKEVAEAAQAPARKVENVVAAMQVEMVSIEVGRDLRTLLLNTGKDAPMLERISSIRKHLALELGIVLPGVRVRENLGIDPHSYLIRVREREVARTQLHPDQLLVVGLDIGELGPRVTDPTYGLPAAWVDPDQEVPGGCYVLDPVSVVATQLTEILRSRAADMLGRDEVKTLLETAKLRHPVVVEEVLGGLSLGTVRAVLRRLLRERVSIRDLVAILEVLADHLSTIRDPLSLTELVRLDLGEVICQSYLVDGWLNVFELDGALEGQLQASIVPTEGGPVLNIDPGAAREILAALAPYVTALQEQGFAPVTITTPTVRPFLRQLTERSLPLLSVVSWSEIPPGVHVRSWGTAGARQPSTGVSS